MIFCNSDSLVILQNLNDFQGNYAPQTIFLVIWIIFADIAIHLLGPK